MKYMLLLLSCFLSCYIDRTPVQSYPPRIVDREITWSLHDKWITDDDTSFFDARISRYELRYKNLSDIAKIVLLSYDGEYDVVCMIEVYPDGSCFPHFFENRCWMGTFCIKQWENLPAGTTFTIYFKDYIWTKEN